MDGANMNALVGLVRPADLGVDVMHFNLHKTFSTPHGGGGPGCGPIAVGEKLAPFLPVPRIEKKGKEFSLTADVPQTIGRVRAFFGNFGIMVRALTYISSLGSDYLPWVSRTAILNANYIKHKLRDVFHLPFDVECMHEVVFNDKNQNAFGIKTMDMAKRLIDYGYHPPTVYFPLVVPGAIMIEPTESESLEDLETFIQSMQSIAREVREENPDVKNAPVRTRTAKVDEVKAAKTPKLNLELN
jgi:glycine dehydrogenase subunit 2